MSVTIQHRRGVSSALTASNPILAAGEMVFEIDTLAYKIGNGSTAWNALPYRALSGEFAALLFNSFDGATEPSVPAAGRVHVYGKDIAGRQMLKWRGPSGLDTPIQPALFSNSIATITPHTTTTFLSFGTPTFTAVGTVSTPTLAVGSLRASTKRSTVTSAATAGSASELRVPQTQCWRGDAPGLGGFFFSERFAAASSVAGQRFFVGLSSVTTAFATTQDPVALTQIVGVGNAAGDANLQILVNDASGTASKIDAGASFPVPTLANNAMYQIDLFAPPNGSTIGYRLSRLDVPAVTFGVLSSDLPTSTTFLAPHLYVNNNGVAAAVVLEFFRHYIESDY